MNKGDTSDISKTNWERVDSLTDEEIDTSDIPPLDDHFFRKARWRRPLPERTVAVQVDGETLAWFQSQGEECEERMAAALRIYAEAHRQGRNG